MSVSLSCTVRSDDADDLGLLVDLISSSLFGFGATAIGEDRPSLDEVVLTAGFVSRDDAKRASSSLADTYGGAVVAMTTETHGSAWAISQRAALRPTHIGPWLIRAPWDPPEPMIAPDHDIVIDPGEAFGHGAHPSTVMTIELMLRSSGTTSHLIDVGTGTGVIAIIGARLGWSVTALEVDPVAVEVAAANIERNSTESATAVDSHIDLRRMDAHDVPVAMARGALVVANVTIDVHRHLAPALASAAVVIASGVLCRQVTELVSLYPNHEAKTIRTHGEWASLELRRHKRLGTGVNG